MRSGPCTDARSRPRSCALKSGRPCLAGTAGSSAAPAPGSPPPCERGRERRAACRRRGRRCGTSPAAPPICSQHAAGVLVVLVLVGRVGAVHEQELGAEQADALGAVLERALRSPRAPRCWRSARTRCPSRVSAGRSRLASSASPIAASRAPAPELRDRRRRRVEDHLAARPVDDDQVAGADRVR